MSTCPAQCLCAQHRLAAAVYRLRVLDRVSCAHWSYAAVTYRENSRRYSSLCYSYPPRVQCSPCLTSSPDLVAELARFATVSHRLRITSLRSMLSPRLEHTTFLPFSQWFLPFRHVTAQGGAPVARVYSPRRLLSSPWRSVPACVAIACRIAMFTGCAAANTQLIGTASYRPCSCTALAIALAVASWAYIAV